MTESVAQHKVHLSAIKLIQLPNHWQKSVFENWRDTRQRCAHCGFFRLRTQIRKLFGSAD